MAPLAWRVALNDLRKGFKVKSSSPVFSKGKHEFCLDVYRDGWGDEDLTLNPFLKSVNETRHVRGAIVVRRRFRGGGVHRDCGRVSALP